MRINRTLVTAFAAMATFGVLLTGTAASATAAVAAKSVTITAATLVSNQMPIGCDTAPCPSPPPSLYVTASLTAGCWTGVTGQIVGQLNGVPIVRVSGVNTPRPTPTGGPTDAQIMGGAPTTSTCVKTGTLSVQVPVTIPSGTTIGKYIVDAKSNAVIPVTRQIVY